MLPSASAQTCDINFDSGDDSTDTPHVSEPKKGDRSPTVKNLLQKAKMRERSQDKKLQKVIKERDALRKQLAYLSKAPREEQSSEEDTASCSSLSSMSRSSSCSSSSSSDEKMKRKGKGKLRLSKTKNKIKKARKHHKVTDVRKRARGPFEVIRRYKKVLKAYNRGMKLSAFCAYIGVNKLTVRSTASIAELATASPAEFTKLLDKTKQAKLKDVANLCENYIKESPARTRKGMNPLRPLVATQLPSESSVVPDDPITRHIVLKVFRGPAPPVRPLIPPRGDSRRTNGPIRGAGRDRRAGRGTTRSSVSLISNNRGEGAVR
ncbi:unnamed protein product [Boreogadus saida]